MFVILSTQRAGTHLLQSLLNSHPDIDCYVEVLHKDISRPIPTGEYEGCIMQYNQVWGENGRKVLSGAKIIHLTRDLDDVAYSRAILHRKKELNFKGLVTESVKVKVPPISPDEIIEIKEKIKRNRQRVLGIIEDRNDIFEITYEYITGGNGIVALSKEKATPMLNYLEVKPTRLTTSYRKPIYVEE